MTAETAHTVALLFLLFCRVGGCMMLMPGFSSPRVPMQIRLFIAIAVTLALSPVMLPEIGKALPDLPAHQFSALVVTETLTGVLIGLSGRMFFLALQFAGTAIAMMSGYSNTGEIGIDNAEPQPALATMLTLTATVLVFITEQHWEILRGLLASYSVIPVTKPFEPQFALIQLADSATAAFIVALRIASPFIVYAILINLLFGLANKLTPQIPVYFVSMPFVLAGGLLLLYFTAAEMLNIFSDQFLGWLKTGG